MKKTLWLLGVAVAALTSCTQSEVVDIPESRVIGFDTHVNKNSRAAYLIQQKGPEATTTKDNLYQFWVYGYENNIDIFAGTKVYWSTTTNGFTYDNHHVWNLNNTYNFAAYSDGNNQISTIEPSTTVTYSKLTTPEEGSQLVFTNYTVGENDLLAAIVSPITIEDDGSNIASVPLNFEHMLSCIKISLKNTSQNLYLKFDDITFMGTKTDNCTYKIVKSNSVFVESCIWNNTISQVSPTAIGTYTLDVVDGYLAPGGTLNLLCFVIPQSNNITTSIKADTYEKVTGNSGETYNKTNETTYNTTLKITDTDDTAPDHSTWQPGYLYNYTADIAGQVHYIHFDVHVEDWVSHNNSLPGTTTTTN